MLFIDKLHFIISLILIEKPHPTNYQSVFDSFRHCYVLFWRVNVQLQRACKQFCSQGRRIFAHPQFTHSPFGVNFIDLLFQGEKLTRVIIARSSLHTSLRYIWSVYAPVIITTYKRSRLQKILLKRGRLNRRQFDDCITK
jgi:hypothetical protein